MSLPYFPMFPSDFEAKTSHLTLAEDGAYNRLLRICWMTPGCTIPADEAWIMRRVRAHTDADKEAVKAILAEYFTAENGRYSNAKLMRIWLEANEAHAKRKNAGAKGGKAKALGVNKKIPSNAVAKPKQPEPEPEPDISDDTNVSSRRKHSPDEGFDSFWGLWPSKKNKQNARKAWRKLSIDDKRAAYSAIRAGWFDQWQAASPDANPIHAATFLNARRWEDQQSAPKLRPIEGGRTNARRPLADHFEDSQPEMDSWADRDPSEPLLSASIGSTDSDCSDAGLGQGAIWLFSGADQRCL